MINSRSIADLHPIVREKAMLFLPAVHKAGYEIIITSTYRDNEAQTALYAIGRTKPGVKVTNAKAGESFHNYRLAFDIVPVRYGKLVWGTTGDDLVLWKNIAKIGKEYGLNWAGDWESFREFPHFQYTGGLALAKLKAGETLS